ncbi:P-loop containing nucleoside triphosphate hydrolase protein, partial [Pavlovales sp. CCMP2436]
GGEKRRVAIAMSMVCSPRVLLLDEPTSGLDSSSAHRIVATLRELASHGRVVMLSIHQPAQRTFEMLSTALLMHQG